MPQRGVFLFAVKPNRRLDAFYWQQPDSQGPTMWTSFFRMIASFFAPRPCDFGARLTAHYGLDV